MVYRNPSTAGPEVRLVRLELMRVASVRAVSQSPERDAWEKLRDLPVEG